MISHLAIFHYLEFNNQQSHTYVSTVSFTQHTLHVPAQLLYNMVCRRNDTAVLLVQVYTVIPHQSQCGLKTGIKRSSAAAFQYSRFTLLVKITREPVTEITNFDRSTAQYTVDYN